LELIALRLAGEGDLLVERAPFALKPGEPLKLRGTVATRPMHEDVQSRINDTFDTSLPSGAVTYREPRPLKIERPAEPKRGWLVGLAALERTSLNSTRTSMIPSL
jgi:hypothetical protein